MENIKRVITAIRAVKNIHLKRSNIFLDGKYAFSLDNEVVVKGKLRVGLELSSTEIDLLAGADQYQRCLNAAFLFLSYRPRSESETRDRLKRRNFEDSDIERVVQKLKQLELLNDAAFAEYWKENRSTFRP